MDLMEERLRILNEARAEAKRIVQDARSESERIMRECNELRQKSMTLEDCFQNEGVRWGWHFLEARNGEVEALNDSLFNTRSKIRTAYIANPHNAIDWGVLSYSQSSVLLGMAGMQMVENAFEKIVKKTMSSGIVHGKKFLLDIIEDVELKVGKYGAKVKFSEGYKALKAEELELTFLIEQMKQREKDRIRKEKEMAKEEAKAQKEYERELKKVKAEEEQVRMALEKAQLEAAKQAANEEKMSILLGQISRLKQELKEAEERGNRIQSMAQQTRRGWVYVISNVGSFGEGVYKIGLTRRLDPMERVYELGDASVPFPFDVHAFIFSDDAPALETALHQAFEKRKLNAVNGRKEYFRVTLEEIKRKVKELGYDVKFEDYAYAPQYRDSVLMKI